MVLTLWIITFIALAYNAYLMGKCAAHVAHIINERKNLTV